MDELPLFPLNTVLFPGTPIHLHIFEERYKRMMEVCIQERRLFGVVLIRSGMEALGPLAEPYDIGCTAQIVHVKRLEQGRLNLVAVGQERFRIVALDSHTRPYFIAQVEALPLVVNDPFALENQADELRGQVDRLVRVLADLGGGAGGSGFDLGRLPEDPAALAYMATAVLQIAAQQKQQVLETPEAGLLLQRVRAIYRRELALAKAVAAHGDHEPGAVFSRN